MLLVRDGIGYPVEIKRSAEPQPADARHFRVLTGNGLELGAGAVVSFAPRVQALCEGVVAVPVGLL